jgi:hypothetical protein
VGSQGAGRRDPGERPDGHRGTPVRVDVLGRVEEGGVGLAEQFQHGALESRDGAGAAFGGTKRA